LRCLDLRVAAERAADDSKIVATLQASQRIDIRADRVSATARIVDAGKDLVDVRYIVSDGAVFVFDCRHLCSPSLL
jgi:hypothetical protein